MRINFLNTIVTLCLALHSITSSANNITLNTHAAITKYFSSHKSNASFLVTHSDKVIANGAEGFFSFEDKKYLSPNQEMPIASGTKPMTAIGILFLRDKGLLDVQDSISKHLNKDNKIWGGKMPEWANIVTIHHLLTHTSGIAEYYAKYNVDQNHNLEQTNNGIVAYAAGEPLLFTPGEKYSYCNTGFVLLGLIIEQVSNKNLSEFFDEILFKPLNMHNTSLASTQQAFDYQQGKLTQYPVRYFAILNNEKPKYIQANADILLSPFADGGVISNTTDLCKLHVALHNGKILSDDSYKLMTTPYMLAHKEDMNSYTGYGLFISHMPNGHIYYNHAGRAAAMRSEAGYIPDSKTCIAILSNVMTITSEDGPKIDQELSDNQIDIMYLRNAIIEATSL